MAVLNFPINPSIGDVYEKSGFKWEWNGYGWRRPESVVIPGTKAEVDAGTETAVRSWSPFVLHQLSNGDQPTIALSELPVVNTNIDGDRDICLAVVNNSFVKIKFKDVTKNSLIDNLNNISLSFNSLLNVLGANNVAIGESSLSNNDSGHSNLSIGKFSLFSNHIGYSNIAIGNYSSYSSDGGYGNIAIGEKALYANLGGIGLVAIGDNALRENQVDANTGIGNYSLSKNRYGQFNTALGCWSLLNLDGGMDNTAIGILAGGNLEINNQNTLIGSWSGRNAKTNSLTGIGYYALSECLDEYTVAIGTGALSALKKSSEGNNLAIGTYSLGNSLNCSNSISIGNWSLYKDTNGNNNISVGTGSLFNNISGSRNLSIGNQSLFNSKNGSFNFSMGYNSLKNLLDEGGTYDAVNIRGWINFSLGNSSLSNLRYGSNNFAIGNQACKNYVAAESIFGIGNGALLYHNGSNNFAIGNYSLSGLEFDPDQIIFDGNISIVGSNLVVNSKNQGTYSVGDFIIGTGLPDSLIVSSVIDSNNFTVNISADVTDIYFKVRSFYGNISITNNILTINNFAYGTLNVDDHLFGTGLVNNTKILNKISDNSFTINTSYDIPSLDVEGISCLGNCNLRNLILTVNSYIFGTIISTNKIDNLIPKNTKITAIVDSNNFTISNYLFCYDLNLVTKSDNFNNTNIGKNNFAIGTYAANKLSTGDRNLAIGSQSCTNLVSGGYNTALGFDSLYTNEGSSANVALGDIALYSFNSSNWDGNVAVGRNAASELLNGSYNILIGTDVASNSNVRVLTNGNGNIHIGARTTPSNSVIDNEIIIGTELEGKGTNTTFIGGTLGIYNEANSASFNTISDIRLKDNIIPYTKGLKEICLVNTYSFSYKKESGYETEKNHIGVLAQEVEKVFPEAIIKNDNDFLSVNNESIIWALLNSIKELKEEINELRQCIKQF